MPSRPTYQTRIIAFIDVLGFGRLVEASRQGSRTRRAILQRISDAFLWAQKSLDDAVGVEDLRYTHFSDSFVLSSTATDSSFSLFLLHISDVIQSCLESGLLLRGGVTIGPLLHTQRLLFGPAVNRAYHLESKVAKVPRIIVDPDVHVHRYVTLLNSHAEMTTEWYTSTTLGSPRLRVG